MFLLEEDNIGFPPIEYAHESGLLAIGGDLSVNRLLNAYYSGIFPWYNPDEPILWHSPDPRFVLFPENLKVQKSMRPYFNQKKFTVTYNQNFLEVIKNCQSKYRPGQEGTWITEEMIEAYHQLFIDGHVLSVEVWKENKIVGGLYGVKIGNIFCGESMFTNEKNASKFGFISLVKMLEKEGVKLIDCQVYTEHLASLGAEEIPRNEFKQLLIKYRSI